MQGDGRARFCGLALYDHATAGHHRDGAPDLDIEIIEVSLHKSIAIRLGRALKSTKCARGT